MEADEAADDDLVTELFADFGDVIFHTDLGIAFHETLIHEAVGLEEFVQNASENFFHRLSRLALEAVGLCGDLAFLGDDFRGNLIARNRVRMTRCDLQCDVADELLELIAVRGFGFACADFHEHADFCAGVDVGSD